jgi:hypothetical protein
MKNTLIILLTTLTFSAFAQPRNHEKIESMRVAFITNRLSLTPEESQKFWPVYNAFKADMKTLRKNFREDDKDGTPLTADQRLEFDQKKLNLKLTYKPQLEATIGKEKMNKLMAAEEAFKKELVRIMQDRRGK